MCTHIYVNLSIYRYRYIDREREKKRREGERWLFDADITFWVTALKVVPLFPLRNVFIHI